MNIPEPAPLARGKVMSVPTQLARRWAGYLLVVAALALFTYQITTTIKGAALMRPAPVSYSEIDTDKDSYAPGELIRFSGVRLVRGSISRPLLLLTIDSFENIDTGEVFPGMLASRVARQSGEFQFSAVRRLPAEITPGRYVFVGWASSQTNPMSEPALYVSRPFRVVANKMPANHTITP